MKKEIKKIIMYGLLTLSLIFIWTSGFVEGVNECEEYECIFPLGLSCFIWSRIFLFISVVLLVVPIEFLIKQKIGD